jgi:hypothetical protein
MVIKKFVFGPCHSPQPVLNSPGGPSLVSALAGAFLKMLNPPLIGIALGFTVAAVPALHGA